MKWHDMLPPNIDGLIHSPTEILLDAAPADVEKHQPLQFQLLSGIAEKFKQSNGKVDGGIANRLVKELLE